MMYTKREKAPTQHLSVAGDSDFVVIDAEGAMQVKAVHISRAFCVLSAHW